ncbi:MAG: hypothetical protein J5544_00635 [Clostridia bacterium]|nr:hypothetical protein [Clostridia bacterium]
MKTITKRSFTLAMTMLLLVMSILVPLEKASAATTYNNTLRSSLTCDVDSNGELSATMSVNGKSGITTHIGVELYIEKKILGIFWSRVDIGCENNIWTDSTNSYKYNHVFTTQLNSTGTYRVTATYTVSGSGGSDDIITKTDTVTY